jgi:hypothetical protein
MEGKMHDARKQLTGSLQAEAGKAGGFNAAAGGMGSRKVRKKQGLLAVLSDRSPKSNHARRQVQNSRPDGPNMREFAPPKKLDINDSNARIP